MTSAASLITLVAGWVGAGSLWQQVRPTIADYAHLALQYWVPLYDGYLAVFSVPDGGALTMPWLMRPRGCSGTMCRPFPPRWFGVVWRIVSVPFLPFVWIARLWDRVRHGRDEPEAEQSASAG